MGRRDRQDRWQTHTSFSSSTEREHDERPESMSEEGETTAEAGGLGISCESPAPAAAAELAQQPVLASPGTNEEGLRSEGMRSLECASEPTKQDEQHDRLQEGAPFVIPRRTARPAEPRDEQGSLMEVEEGELAGDDNQQLPEAQRRFVQRTPLPEAQQPPGLGQSRGRWHSAAARGHGRNAGRDAAALPVRGRGPPERHQQQPTNPWDASALAPPEDLGLTRRQEHSMLRARRFRHEAAERAAAKVHHAAERQASVQANLQRELREAERAVESCDVEMERRLQRSLRGAQGDLVVTDSNVSKIRATGHQPPLWLQAERAHQQKRAEELQRRLDVVREQRLAEQLQEEIDSLAAYPATPVRDPSANPAAQQAALPDLPRQAQFGPTGHLEVGFWAVHPDSIQVPAPPCAPSQALPRQPPQQLPQAQPRQQPQWQPQWPAQVAPFVQPPYPWAAPPCWPPSGPYVTGPFMWPGMVTPTAWGPSRIGPAPPQPPWGTYSFPQQQPAEKPLQHVQQ